MSQIDEKKKEAVQYSNVDWNVNLNVLNRPPH